MHHKSGNFEAFARPRKPKGVDEKSAYIVGAGIASPAWPQQQVDGKPPSPSPSPASRHEGWAVGLAVLHLEQ